MTPLIAIGLIWTWHLLFMALLTYSVARAAYHDDQWPVCRPRSCGRFGGRCKWLVIKWPVSGRWLMTALLLTVTLMIGDLTRVVWQTVLDLRGGNGVIGWDSIVIRAIPCFIMPWTFWRQWTHGLVNDDWSKRERRRRGFQR